MKLNKEERNKFYRDMLEVFNNDVPPGLCFAAERVAKDWGIYQGSMSGCCNGVLFDPYCIDFFEHFLPEIQQFKPETTHSGTHWFIMFDKLPRIAILEKAIQLTA